jgi:sensor histidine kinase YesM
MTKPVDKMRQRFAVAVFWFVAATFFFLLRFTYKYLDDLAREVPGTLAPRLLEEGTGTYSAALLFLFVILLLRKHRVRQKSWLQQLAIHLCLVVCFSVIHTSLMAVTRSILFPLFGLGKYNYGILPIRYVMEFGQQFLSYFSLVAMYYVFDSYREARQRELQTAHLETRLAQAQLQTLQSQLQPHFLFNALNTISAVVYEDARLADTMISRLSDFLRSLLNASQAQEVTLKEELRFLDLYLDIMRPRFEDRLQVQFDIAPETEEAMVPKLVLQPLVENSIKHAADPASGNVRIAVTAARSNGAVLLAVKDDGAGISATPQNGIGLSNTRQRLEYLYGAEQEFTMQNAEAGGLLIQIKVPYHRQPLTQESRN